MRLARGAVLAHCLGLALAAPSIARADVEIESESVYRSYDTPSLSEEDVVLTPFSQAFRLTAAERGEDSRVAFETYFRGIGNQSNQGPGIREQARVYYAFVDVAYGRRHPMDLRMGRQTTAAGGDLLAFDGARFRYKGPLHFGVEAYGGTTVSGFGAFVPIGVEDGGSHMAGGVTGGLAVFLTGVPGTQARLGVRRINRDGEVDREDVIADVSQRFWRMRAYANAEISTVLLVVDEGLLGATLYAGRGTFVDVEGFHYTPTFGAQSIFNVFNIEPYDEGRFRVRTSFLSGRLGVWTRVGHAIYGGGESSDSLNVGATARVSTHLGVSARGFHSSGYLGARTGGGTDVRYAMLDGRLALLVGGTAASARNDILRTSDGTYLSAVGGLSYTVPDRAELSVLVEQLADDFSSGEPRLTAAFRFKFGAGSARRAALDGERRRVNP